MEAGGMGSSAMLGNQLRDSVRESRIIFLKREPRQLYEPGTPINTSPSYSKTNC